MREKLLAAVRARTAHGIETGDSRWVLAPEALEEAGALLAPLLGSDEDPDLEVLRAVGELYWLRVQALPVDEWDEDLRMAAILYQPVYQADPDAVPEQLRSLYAEQARRPEKREREGGRVDPAACTDQGAELFDRFLRNGDLEALEKAVHLFRTALSAVPEDHPMYGPCLSNMHAAASALADETGDADVQQEAVSAGLTLLEVIDERDPEYPEHASEVGLSLRSLFERTGVVGVLRKSVELARSAVAATPGDGAIRAGRLSNLGVVLQMLHEYAGDARAIDEAITAGRDAVAAMPVGDPDRATCLSNLGNTLRVAFEASGDTAMLREAVAVGRAASASLPADHTARQAVLANLGVSLRELFEAAGDANLLHEAVVAHRQVDAATPDGHPSQASRLTNLGNTLRALYDHSGDRQALDDAVAAGRRAVAAIPDGHPMRAASLSNLGSSLLAQFDETDDLRTLGEAVSANRKALAAIPVDHPWHARFQSNLGISLHMLFKRTGDLDILREAIAAGRAAVTEVPDGHPELVSYVTGLSATLRTAFTKSEDQQALSDARNALSDIAATGVGARDGLAEDDPVRSMSRSDLEPAAQDPAEETGSKRNPDPEAELDERPAQGSTRDHRLRQVRGRVDRFTTTRTPEVVLGSDAIGEVVDLLCSVPDPVQDIEVAQTAGWLFWSRFAARGTVDGEPELMIALDLLAPLYPLGAGAVPELIGELWDDKPPAKPDGAAVLAKLGRAQFREAQDNDDDAVALNRSVDLLRRAVAVAGSDHPDYAQCLTNLGSALLTRFERAKLPADLSESIEFCRAAVGVSRPDEPARAIYLSNLGNALLTRFEHLASEADLDAAIEAGQAAVTGWPDHPDHAAMVSNLDLALRTRAAFGDQAAGLDRRVEEARIGSSAPDGPDAAELSELLLARFERAGDPADLDEAIQVRRDAVATAVDDSGRASHLSGLCDLLRVRFVHFGHESDLTDAIAHGRAAVAATPAGDPELDGRQANLANALSRRYKNTGDLDDLTEAAALGRSAVAATPVGDFNRPHYLASLCDTLRTLFERTDRLADIDEAVEAGRAALDAAPRHSPNLPAFLGNLGAALLARFRHTGSQTDLDESVDLLRRAALAAQAASPDRALMLANLGAALQIRFDSVHDPEDLDEAIDVCREAVRATPLEHSGRAARLSNLAGALQARFGIGGEATDLHEAVEAGRSAVEAHPPGHPARVAAWSNYALVLRGWYEHSGRPADLDAAVAAARAAVAEAPADHPGRPAYLANLSGALRDRHARTGADADLDGALTAAREAASAEMGPPRVRAVAAARWGSLAAAAGRWAEAVAGYQATVDLLAGTVPRQLARRDQEFLLDGTHEIGSDAAACCVRVGSVAQAVELFEQGRGLLLSQALDGRTDLTALAERHPEPASRFTALCAELDSHGPADDVVARRATATSFDRLVADIRKLPGFDRFLRPPAVADLAPDEGQVVIVSVSRYGSYALILPADGEVTAVPLPTLTPDAVLAEVGDFLRAVEDTTANSARTRAAAQDRMARTLGWLWDTVAGPVLDAVGITGTPRGGESWPRLWWCPSGLLSFLPLHAAGHHDTASDAVPRTVLDRVVCSVTPTLRTFAHSRRAADSPPPRAGRAVVVAMPKTPGGYADLSGAEAETAVLRRHFPGEVDVRTGTAATRDAVLDALTGARWAHFACHGHSDLADPSAGRLVLADHHNRPLTVVDLARLRMDDAELAFLSACSTARPSGWLADEAIHVASAFQLAGYRHVIGTLWRIGDWQAVDVADLVYSAIADGAGVAEAVHSATRRMRDRWPDDPSAWASHIHVGT
ncbi:CHAT domain-containing protein [Streptomyces sp. GMR22]|uniref:CHAT domain-containing protein n=1 Tax=Streptomyces sp. GMR22 TaxID=2759524 RepID=UPI0015FE4678|nr:CHAT domain-containing protein [Streptomyces sp. GMR22]MBA6434600.1 CHAT domain-containing protein [Streptomyces sp. GMR22]